ncbi:unnamed protein product [Cylindrotheca closterium]|uniref:Leucine-rich repeat-containing N-terminal plant-type domain-containing protein n=1 Tax=Cylindrotheca closterium TaxID=2856 RepID=A0AAD2GBK6_9STRA|nr:unnamed protein product [Cylindrotheca closterium]
MSSGQQNDELERIQDRLNRAKSNRTDQASSIPSAAADSSVTSRIRPSAGSTVSGGASTTSGASSAAPGTWESISITSPGGRSKKKMTSPLAGIRKTFGKAASSRRIVAQDQSINLRGNPETFSPTDSGRAGSMSMFSRDSSSRNIGQPPFADEYNDAAPNAESEEYLESDKSRNRLSPVMAQIVGFCVDCYTSMAYHADRLYLNCARGGAGNKMTANIVMIIIAVAAAIGVVVHFSKAGSSSDGGSALPITLSGRAGEVQRLIAEAGVTPMEVLGDKTSIQYAALQWVANKDPAKLKTYDSALMERYILAVFYYASNPDEWTNNDGWMTATGYCAWYGVECVPRDDATQESGISRTYDDNDAITGITLTNNNLKGTLPPEFGKLSNTLSLDFGNNILSGEIPEMHENLKYLLVPNNEFVGSFPEHFKGLANLHGLDLSYNAMHGYVTERINELTNLRTLDMSNNHFGGSFPEIHHLTKITKLHLQNNIFHGTIPSGKLRDYERLEILRLDNNTFSGPFPKQSIERLTRIEYIDLSQNDLTGSIPDIFQSIRRLTTVHLNNNRFRAHIPDSLMHLSGLKSLRLDHNVLTGKIPETVALLADVQYFDLHDNLLTGEIPTYIGFPHDFTYISLKNNKLTGSIPTEMGDLFRLAHLELEGNRLNGDIPTQLASLTALTKLSIHENQFAGITMPIELCDKIRRAEMKELSADCTDSDKVTCDCCSQCYPLAGTN